MIERVISGGQTVADIAGLRSARRYGLATGGWMPRNFSTQNGPRPEYADLYGMQEHSSDKYPPRTFANVRDSDGTMRLAHRWNSPGELCTLKAIRQYNRPYFDVCLDAILHDPKLIRKSIREAIDWIEIDNIKVLNIAGNAEKTHKGIEKQVEAYLDCMFRKLGYKEIT